MLVLVAASAAGQTFQVASDPRPAPRFEGASIPDPPQQKAPWTRPPTTLPRFLLDATARLFEQGVADPRGCEYRDVEVGETARFTTRGFVFPTEGAQRFVVGWDGVVRPALTVGPARDLGDDIRRIAAAAAAERAKADPSDRSDAFLRPWRQSALDADSRSPLRLVLLLRLGRADLAEALFAASTSWRPGAAGVRDLTDYGMSYLTLADEWADTVFARAAEAHARGDDVVALDAARRVDAFRAAAQRTAAEMGFPKEPRRNGDWPTGPGPAPDYFPGLRQLAVLLADQERRAKEPPRAKETPAGADAAVRIAAMVRDLDQIAERQMMSPGAARPADSALARKLIAEGDAAVGPLLDVLAHDRRLTRSLSHGRGFLQQPILHPVYEVALPALQAILGSHTIPGAETTVAFDDARGRQAQADAVRAYWQKNRQVPAADRWYRTLADDAAGTRRWKEAAAAIVAPAGRPGPPAYYPDPIREPLPTAADRTPMAGEALRERRDPSVTELLTRRALDLSRDPNTLYEAAPFAAFLHRWDPAAALPVIRDVMRRAVEASARTEPGSGSSTSAGFLAPIITRFTEMRVSAGDAAALDEYAGWIRSQGPKSFQNDPVPSLEPLWKHADRPSIAAAARWMFTDRGSPWLPLHRNPQELGFFNPHTIETTPLIGLAPFREAVYAELADRTEIARVTVEPPSLVRFELTVTPGGSGGFNSGSPELAALDPKTTTTLRVCDAVAYRLATLDGTPPFELFWPEPRRDAAVAALTGFLKRFGDRFADVELPGDFPSGPGRPAHLTFPDLGRPATADDVKADRAIFTLADQADGPARVVMLPSRPVLARWVTLKEFPYNQQTGDGQFRLEHDQAGWVWQAEEVGTGASARRFFGFVGNSTVARVPASEIEFPLARYGESEGQLSSGLDARLSVPQTPRIQGTRPKEDEPFDITLTLHNRQGDDHKVPLRLAAPGGDGKPALLRGVDLEVAHAKAPASQRGPFQLNLEWTPVPPTRATRFDPAAAPDAATATRTLGPAATAEAGTIALVDWFDLSRPGYYRVTVTFAPPSGLGTGRTNTLVFSVGQVQDDEP